MAARLTSRWWLWSLGIFLASRVVTTLLMLLAAWLQNDNYWSLAHPDYFTFAGFWDSEWYGRIFDHGYPTVLPVGDNGLVNQNEWAFLPLFPMLVKATFLPWKIGAPILATLFAAAFALVAYRVFFTALGNHERARWALALTLFCAVSPILQVGYSESLSLLAIAIALWAMQRSRWWLVALILPVVAFARPGVLAFAAAFGFMFIASFFNKKYGWIDRLFFVGLSAWAGVLGLAWPFIAGVVTGNPNAYLLTEMSWRYGVTGSLEFVPFSGWFIAFSSFFGGPIGIAILLLIIGNLVYLLFAKEVRQLGVLTYWVAGYLVYLFAVFFPQSSTWRLLYPLFPLGAAIAVKLPNWSRGAALLAFITSQWLWIQMCWTYAPPDFTPP